MKRIARHLAGTLGWVLIFASVPVAHAINSIDGSGSTLNGTASYSGSQPAPGIPREPRIFTPGDVNTYPQPTPDRPISPDPLGPNSEFGTDMATGGRSSQQPGILAPEDQERTNLGNSPEDRLLDDRYQTNGDAARNNLPNAPGTFNPPGSANTTPGTPINTFGTGGVPIREQQTGP